MTPEPGRSALPQLLTSVQLAPQGTSWPMYQYDSTHNAVFQRPGFRVAWVAEFGDRINGGLAVVGDTIFADSFDSHLYALNLESGSIKWSRSATNILMSTPVVSGNTVVVGSGRDGLLTRDGSSQIWGREEGDDVLAFDARDGTALWTFHTVGEDMPSPAIAGDRVVFANGDLHAYALDLRNGRILWKTPLPGVDTMASATLVGDNVLISTCRVETSMVCGTQSLRASDGRLQWSNVNGGSDSSPSSDGHLVFVDGSREEPEREFDPGGQDVLAALAAETGSTRWKVVGQRGPYAIVASGEHDIAGTVVNGVLYQSTVNDDTLSAYDVETGQRLWRCRTMAPVKMSPVVTNTQVIFGDIAGILYDVNRGTGLVQRTGSFKDPFSTSPPVVVGDTLLIANGRFIFAIPMNTI